MEIGSPLVGSVLGMPRAFRRMTLVDPAFPSLLIAGHQPRPEITTCWSDVSDSGAPSAASSNGFSLSVLGWGNPETLQLVTVGKL